MMYRVGHGVDKDVFRAHHYLRKADQAGVADVGDLPAESLVLEQLDTSHDASTGGVSFANSLPRFFKRMVIFRFPHIMTGLDRTNFR
jgi:hypothetical protein